MQAAEWHASTRAVIAGRPERTEGAAVGPPVELTSTYVSSAQYGEREVGVYGRMDNATWRALEQAIGSLEQGSATCFASGMAAVDALLGLVPRGGRVVMADTIYNTTGTLARQLAGAGLFRLVSLDITDTPAVVAALEGADWLIFESPTNPLLQVADIAALRAAAQGAGVRVAVDNTFATPLLQNPLALGADVVLHSGTKYLSGHSDVVMGALVSADNALEARIRAHRSLHGAILGPMEAWLTLRGLRTLPVRLERQQASAGVLASRLNDHPAVRRVRYPGLPSHPGHQLAAAQMRGFGAMLAIELASVAAAEALVAAVRLWVPATSLGGVESLLERRRRIPSEPGTVPEELIRLSVGLEDVEDLWADLDQALSAAGS